MKDRKFNSLTREKNFKFTKNGKSKMHKKKKKKKKYKNTVCNLSARDNKMHQEKKKKKKKKGRIVFKT